MATENEITEPPMLVDERADRWETWSRQYARKRNWLLIWRMKEKELNGTDLAKRIGVRPIVIYGLMNHPGNRPSEALLKKICIELEANPCEIGLADRRDFVRNPFRVDIFSLHEVMEVFIEGMISTADRLKCLQKRIDDIYFDYMDRCKDADANDVFVRRNVSTQAILSDDDNFDDWLPPEPTEDKNDPV